TLDVREPGLVEPPRDLQLVGQRQHEALALGAVAQGRVVQEDRVAHAGALTSATPMRPRRKSVTESVPASPPRSAVRGPRSIASSFATSSAAAASSSPREWRSIRAADATA